MEDEHVIIDKYGGIPTQGFFAVYDGHGGKKAADYVKTNLHENILKDMKSNTTTDALNSAFLSTDRTLKSLGEKSGCTAAVAIITKKENSRLLYSANCGDARIVLCKNKHGIRLTKDHKASDPDESARIDGLGGLIVGGKVGASLAVTRAFGDFELRNCVVAEPLVTEWTLTDDCTWVIIACDGLWDVASDQEAADLVATCTTAQEASDKLLKYALSHETKRYLSFHEKDNVSVIAIKL